MRGRLSWLRGWTTKALCPASWHRSDGNVVIEATQANHDGAPAADTQPRHYEPTRFRIASCFGALFAFAAFVLSPLLRGGWAGDDAYMALQTRAYLAATGQSLWGATLEYITYWLRIGRIYPLAAYVVPLFYALDGNLLLYRFLYLALILADVAVFGVFVQRLSKSAGYTILSMVALVACLQIATSQDVMTGFWALIQVTFTFLILSLLLWLKYLDTSRKGFLVASLALFAASVLTYEVTLPVFLVYIAIAVWYPDQSGLRQALRRTRAFTYSIGVFLTSVLLLRFFSHIPLATHAKAVAAEAYRQSYQLSPNPIAVARTLAVQLTGSIPLVPYVARLVYQATTADAPNRVLGPLQYVTRFPVTSALVALGYAAITALGCRTVLREPRLRRGVMPMILWTGLGLFVLPATLITLSTKYQLELHWGVAYLPAYASYFGIAMLIGAGAYAALHSSAGQRWGKSITVLVCAVAVLAGVLNFQNNRVVMEHNNEWVKYPREVLEASLQRGLFTQIPPGSVLLVANPGPWDVPAFYFKEGVPEFEHVVWLSGTATDLTSLETLTESTTTDGARRGLSFGARGKVWLLRYKSTSPGSGYATAYQVDSVVVEGGTIKQVFATIAAAYIDSSPSASGSPDSLLGDPLPSRATPDLAAAGIGRTPPSPTSAGTGWRLYRLPPTPPAAFDFQNP